MASPPAYAVPLLLANLLAVGIFVAAFVWVRMTLLNALALAAVALFFMLVLFFPLSNIIKEGTSLLTQAVLAGLLLSISIILFHTVYASVTDPILRGSKVPTAALPPIDAT